MQALVISDIVDRGPETPHILDYSQQTPNARTLMGSKDLLQQIA